MEKRGSMPSSRFLVAVCLVASVGAGCAPEPVAPPGVYARVVEGNVFDTEPVFGAVRPLRLRRTGFEYRCMECHEDFDSPDRQGELRSEHAGIFDRFAHGLNTNCMNCHHREQRDSYVDREGGVLAPERVELLCAQCHGPIFRDWNAGVHGRQNGYWDKSRGERTRLVCTQCHDPHLPAFPLMAPDPPPPHSRLDTSHGSSIPEHSR